MITPEDVAVMRQALGLPEPLFLRYLYWWSMFWLRPDSPAFRCAYEARA